MPLLFAIVGIIALALSFVVLVGPVLLVIAVVRAVRTARRANAPQPPVYAALTASPRWDCRSWSWSAPSCSSSPWPEPCEPRDAPRRRSPR